MVLIDWLIYWRNLNLTVSFCLLLALPCAPVNVQVVDIDARKASITFSPVCDGNTSILQVNVDTQTRDMPPEEWRRFYVEKVNVSGSGLTVSGLAPFTEYRIRLVVENVVGPSAPSVASGSLDKKIIHDSSEYLLVFSVHFSQSIVFNPFFPIHFSQSILSIHFFQSIFSHPFFPIHFSQSIFLIHCFQSIFSQSIHRLVSNARGQSIPRAGKFFHEGHQCHGHTCSMDCKWLGLSLFRDMIRGGRECGEWPSFALFFVFLAACDQSVERKAGKLRAYVPCFEHFRAGDRADCREWQHERWHCPRKFARVHNVRGENRSRECHWIQCSEYGHDGVHSRSRSVSLCATRDPHSPCINSLEWSKGKVLFKKWILFPSSKANRKIQWRDLKNLPFYHIFEGKPKNPMKRSQNFPSFSIFKSKPKNPMERSQESSILSHFRRQTEKSNEEISKFSIVFHLQKQIEKSNGEISRIFHSITFSKANRKIQWKDLKISHRFPSSKANRKIQWRDLKNLPFYHIFEGKPKNPMKRSQNFPSFSIFKSKPKNPMERSQESSIVSRFSRRIKFSNFFSKYF